MGTMEELFAALLEDESGQDLAEYGLLLALITVALVAAVTAFSDEILAAFESATDALATDGGGTTQ